MEYNVQVKVDGVIAFVVHADTLEEALQIGRKTLGKVKIYSNNVEVVSSEEEITGIY